MNEPDLFAGLVERAPERPITVDMARYQFVERNRRLSVAFDVRVQLPGQATPRLCELRMDLNPFNLAALVREGRRVLENMGEGSLLLTEGERRTQWAGTTGVAL